ncbi:TatD family hydrolase [candidate division WWE3 bacterium]|uniref:TatD family hydrolase n=1 Tax=candidate division WWE3 bacterium TaxID=2053526 RepID=A0A955RNY1_UNCKA|nr:TatD family hydrolase [candidate division WWE3 bacterium]
MFIDTHCHLYEKRLRKNLGNILEQSAQAGVITFIVPAIDLKTIDQTLELSKQYNNVYPAIGIHPTEIKSDTIDHDLNVLKTHLQENPNVVAIGEIGLDATCVEDIPMQTQIEVLTKQIDLSLIHHLPTIIHNRGCTDELIDGLSQYSKSDLQHKMVFHCCEPNKKLLNFAVQNEIFMGLDGDVTYDPEKRQFVSQIPLELLVLETDAPYLLPEPLRSEKKYPNTPANIPIFAQLIAEKYAKPLEEIAASTTQNAQTLFQLPS